MKPTERKSTRRLSQIAELASQPYRFKVRIWLSTIPLALCQLFYTTQLLHHLHKNPNDDCKDKADVAVDYLIERLCRTERCRADIDDPELLSLGSRRWQDDSHVDEYQPSDEKPHVFTSDPLRDVAVAFDRKSIAVKLDKQPPQECSAIESDPAHKDI